MLELITGGFGTGTEEEIFYRIALLLAGQKRAVLIVPEQQTVAREQEMAKRLPPSAPLLFEVTNFTRLADTVFRALGGLGKESSGKAKRALLMWKTLSDLSPRLGLTHGKKITVSMVDSMLATVGELQGFGISPDDLARALENDGVAHDGRLAGRVRDLALILQTYRETLSARYTDVGETVRKMTEKLDTHPDFFSDVQVFVEGFTSFTEQQYDALCSLMARTAVTVALTLPKRGEDAFVYTEVRHAKERLLALAKTADPHRNPLVRRSDGNRTTKSALLSEMPPLLFSVTGSLSEEALAEVKSGVLRVTEAKTPYEECDFLAADILARVQGSGARFDDFAIVMRDTDTYSGILDVALRRAKIPLFFSKRRDISGFEAIKTIYTAYATVNRGFRREDVLTYAKCGVYGIPREACDEFELYCEKWQIDRTRFLTGPFVNNPDGYTDRHRPDEAEILLRINDTKDALIAPLVAFRDALLTAKTVREHCEVLYRFLVSVRMEEALAARAAELAALGEEEESEGNARLFSTICDALDTLVEVLGDSAVSAESFPRLLPILFGEAEIGRIPAHMDEVVAGGADRIRLSGKKHVYLIGADYGIFPAAAGDSSFFSEKDKELLAAAALPILPDRETRSARELFCFSRGFASATESVTVSYFTADAGFAKAEPAEVIARIAALTGGKITPKKVSELPLVARIGSADTCFSLLREVGAEEEKGLRAALCDLGYGDRLLLSDLPTVNDDRRLSAETVRALYGDLLELSQSKMEAFRRCPFAFYCHYNLALSEDERADFNPATVGTFVHAILERFMQHAKATGRTLSAIPVPERAELVSSVSQDLLESLAGTSVLGEKRKLHLIRRLRRATLPVIDNLAGEFDGCGYRPVFFELAIEKNDRGMPEPLLIPLDGGKISVHGKVDRVDTLKVGEDVYVRVIDYKTGNKSFSPADLDEGKNLQMFLYLKALVGTESKKFRSAVGLGKNGELLPGGVIYMITDVSDTKIDAPSATEAKKKLDSAQKRLGMVLDDPDALAGMNPAYSPVRFKTDGTADKRTADKLYTREGWEKLSERLDDVVRRFGREIRSGDIAARPEIGKSATSVCAYCHFRPICRKAKGNAGGD